MIFNRKKIKTTGKQTLKLNYRKYVIVCLIILLIGGGYSGTRDALFSAADPNIISDETTQTTLDRLPSSTKNNQAVDDFVRGIRNIDLAKDDTLNKMRAYKPTRGIFAQFFNNISSSGDFISGSLNAVNHIAFKGQLQEGIIIYAALLIGILFSLFIAKILSVGEKRVFLESRRYTGTKVERILFPFQVRRVLKLGLAFIRLGIYNFLWMLTVVGAFIKRYSYYMVPYILAENPNITGKEAIALSRTMMNGHKWEMCKLELSFIGWYILNSLSFGLVGIFYFNPYKTCCETEVYMALRREAITKNLPGSNLLNDVCLDPEMVVPEAYPVHEYHIAIPKQREWLKIDYNVHYPIQHLILIFFSFAFVGWIWEVSLHLVTDGVFVNRGVLFGPWLPIYGAGSVLVLILLRPFRHNHLLTFFLAILVCGVIEYATSYFLEMKFHTKWWDYTGYLLNINGRVCLEGLLVFGLGCYAIIYLVAPLLESLFSRLSKRLGWIIATILIALFLTDVIHSHFHPNKGKGITDYQSQTTKKMDISIS